MSKNLDNLTNFLDSLPKEIEAKLKKDTVKKIAENTKETVKERITQGFGVSKNNGTEKKFKDLKDSTIRKRQALAKKGKLSSKTTPATSNQTETGIMVSDIKSTTNGLDITIKPSAAREDVAAKQEEMGRPSFYLSKKEIDVIENTVEDVANQVLNNLLKSLK